MQSAPPPAISPENIVQPDPPASVGLGRYDLVEQIGRGGMAIIYRAWDRVTRSEVALKRLTAKQGATPSDTAIELFEREYHTLDQLAHPCVVRVFDYGVDGGAPFYTMELLDGGDLRTLAPMPWRKVSMVAYEVCSVLSMLHSRQLVHRDITPRNVRLTAAGGAKLIDFGLLSPMGAALVTAGTPPYVPPELANHTSLDGRSDLFSLGCTLYCALTGYTAYPANSLAELRIAWSRVPKPITKLRQDVPEALWRLVTELMRLDMHARPRSAAEVMGRLLPLLPTAVDATLGAARAHLGAPVLVGRDKQRVSIRKQMLRAATARAGGFLITGEPGTGRTRLLDVFTIEAKLLGAITARADAREAAAGPFALAQAIVNQIHAAAGGLAMQAAAQDPKAFELLYGSQSPLQPEVCEVLSLAEHKVSRSELQAALRSFILALAKRQLIALAVDDLEQVDEPSAALLASLSLADDGAKIVYAATVTPEARTTPSPALSVLGERARSLATEALSLAAAERVLGSLFGDVPNLQAVAWALHRLSRGRPREIMLLAQHLVDTGVIAYASGSWRLPEQVDESAVPADIESALHAQVYGLSETALRVARLLALTVVGRLNRDELISLLGVSPAQLQDALDELRRARLLGGTKAGYVLGQPGAHAMLLQRDCGRTPSALHDQLAAVYETSGATPLAIVLHRLQGHEPDAAVKLLLELLLGPERGDPVLREGADVIGRDQAARAVALADEQAARSGLGPRARHHFWYALASIIARGADIAFNRSIPRTWLEVLKRCSGFDDWQLLGDIADPQARAQQAVATAAERHARTDERERIMEPREAINELVRYVSIGFTIANRTRDIALSYELAQLLAPFAALRKGIELTYRNAQSAYLTAIGAYEASREILAVLVEQLEAANVAPAIQIATRLHRRSISINGGLCSLEAEPVDWIGEGEAQYRVFAEGVNAVAALHRGDLQAAEGHRKQAELVALQFGTDGAFALLTAELLPRAVARDLSGVRAIRDAMAVRARTLSGWQPELLLAEAHLQVLYGEPKKALQTIERLREGQALSPITGAVVYSAIALEIELLVAAGEVALAKQRGEEALARCMAERRTAGKRSLALALALADAAAGDSAAARERVASVIAQQRASGAAGLLWGLSHEYLARVEMQAGDVEAFERAATVAAEAYRAHENSMFAGRYRRLLEDAALLGMGGLAMPEERAEETGSQWVATALTQLTMMSERGENEELTKRVLSLLCDVTTQDGWLYLLTDSGLEYVAGSRELEDVEAMRAKAEERLKLEVGEMSTRTLSMRPEGQSEQAESLNLPSSEVKSIALSAMYEGCLQVVGVVMLSQGGTADPPPELVQGLAKHLIESGAFRPRLSV